jgi:hypothetical protein
MKAMKMCLAVALLGGCVGMEEDEATGATEQAAGGTSLYHQSWIGAAAYGQAGDPSNGSFGNVTAFSNGSGPNRNAFMQFYYQGPDPTSFVCNTFEDPWWGSWTYCFYSRFITKVGYGPIPASDFTVDGRAASARLHTTTGPGFYTETCVHEWAPWYYGNCTYGEPASFDLAWQPDGFASFSQNGTRAANIGAKTFRQSGSWVSKSAHVSGTALGFTIPNGFGGIDDTKGATVTNDVFPYMP